MPNRRHRKTKQQSATVVVATPLSRPLFEQFHALAVRQGVTRSVLLRRLVRSAVGQDLVAAVEAR
jgi:hypothetical protein